MSGHGHIVSTAVLVATGLTATELRGWTDLGWQAGLFVVVAAGAALLPDIDLAHSTAGTVWGPVSRVPLEIVEPALKAPARRRWPLPHRWLTHDVLVGPTVFAVSAFLFPGPVVIAATVGLTLAVGNRLKWFPLDWPMRLALSLLAGMAVLFSHLDLPWLPVAVWVGSILHIAEDRLSNIVPYPGETLQYAIRIK